MALHLLMLPELWVLKNGVEVYDLATQKQLATYFDSQKEQKEIVKFVPGQWCSHKNVQVFARIFGQL